MTSAPTLLLLPALSAAVHDDGSFTLTRKFLDGVLAYQELWPGRIHVAMPSALHVGDNLGLVTVHPRDLPFHLSEQPGDASALDDVLRDADVALVTLVDRYTSIAARAARFHVPVVYISEYSLLTRRQIIAAESSNPILRWRRSRYAARQERLNIKAVRLATGVQANGTPTFEAYRRHNANTLLYFDTRVSHDMLVDPAALDRRLAGLQSEQPLRLCYSGRLIAMKGADHLVPVARELRALCVPFTLTICGAGALAERMKSEAASAGLQDVIKFTGEIDFHTALMPLVSMHMDLFVCCHRQGDPSCTYLETMSCGVPIIGYDNEAFAGLVRTSGVGWTTPLDQPQALARAIADLCEQKGRIADASREARRFAAGHTFEKTMRARIDHLLAAMNAHAGAAA